MVRLGAFAPCVMRGLSPRRPPTATPPLCRLPPLPRPPCPARRQCLEVHEPLPEVREPLPEVRETLQPLKRSLADFSSYFL